MKQRIGPVGIVIGICVLILIIVVLYRVFLPAPSGPPAGMSFHRPSYGPPGGAGGPGAGAAPANARTPPAARP